MKNSLFIYARFDAVAEAWGSGHHHQLKGRAAIVEKGRIKPAGAESNDVCFKGPRSSFFRAFRADMSTYFIHPGFHGTVTVARRPRSRLVPSHMISLPITPVKGYGRS